MLYSLVVYNAKEKETKQIASNLALIVCNAKVVSDQEEVDPAAYAYEIHVPSTHTVILHKSSEKEELKTFELLDDTSLSQVGLSIAKMIKDSVPALKKEDISLAIEEFLTSHNTMTLCTGTKEQVRATPIEYDYINGEIYIITEGGVKFIGLLANPKVSMAVYEPYKSMGQLKGLQIAATAQEVEYGTEEYFLPLERKQIKRTAVEHLPITLHVMRFTPTKFEFLNSEFKKQGVDAKQIIEGTLVQA